jgi:hypothetical protein
MPLYPTKKIPHELGWDRTRASAATGFDTICLHHVITPEASAKFLVNINEIYTHSSM